MSSTTERSFIARTIHALALPIILFWIAVVVILSLFVPSLEVVGQQRSVSLSPTDAPSFVALKHIGHAFNEGDTDSSAMIVLEGDQPLGDDAHRYYDAVIRKLREDKVHVLSVQDFWGDPLTAAGAQSNDGKATTVQVNLAGNQGELLANDSVEAVRKIVNSVPPPPGVKPYVTGVSALAADLHHSGDKSMLKITATTIAVILIMLLFVYRSIRTVFLLLVTVGIELSIGPGRCRVSRAERAGGAFHLRGQPAHVAGYRRRYRLWDFHHWPLPRGPPSRRGQGIGLLHHV